LSAQFDGGPLFAKPLCSNFASHEVASLNMSEEVVSSGVDQPVIRGLHSSTFQLNLSRV